MKFNIISRFYDENTPAGTDDTPGTENKGVPVKAVVPEDKFVKDLGFDSIDALKEALGKAQSYDAMKGDYEKLVADSDKFRHEADDMRRQIIMRDGGVKKDRYDDALTWFKGKGLQMDEKSLADAISKHPEWKETTAQFGAGEKKEEPKRDDDSFMAKAAGLTKFADPLE